MSRRFAGRHAKVKANPKAEPAPPVKLTDENSFADKAFPDRRIPKVLNGRVHVRATVTLDREREEAAKAAQRAAEEAKRNAEEEVNHGEETSPATPTSEGRPVSQASIDDAPPA